MCQWVTLLNLFAPHSIVPKHPSIHSKKKSLQAHHKNSYRLIIGWLTFTLNASFHQKKNTCEVEREIEIIKNNKLVYIIIEARIILYISLRFNRILIKFRALSWDFSLFHISSGHTHIKFVFFINNFLLDVDKLSK